MSERSSLRLEFRDHVAILTLDRPEKLNALSKDDLIEFGAICNALRENEQVRAVILTGAGRGFCSGADTRQTDAASGESVFVAATRFMGTRLDFISPLLGIAKPTIAAVNGIAVGAGLGMALACDIRLVGESGAFLANFNAVGLPAIDGVAYLLPRLIGTQRALEMVYLGERVDSAAALACGLASRIVPDDALFDEALELANRIAAMPPVAVQMTKQAVLSGLDRPWSEALVQQELAYLSAVSFAADDIAETVAARNEKRAGAFGSVLPYPKAS